MNLVEPFRNAAISRRLLEELHRIQKKRWVIMEICGGQTHSLLRSGIDQLLPENLQLVHGPGCPVCVTPIEIIDKAIILAGRAEVIFTTFGDMLRVPGSAKDLFAVKSEGGDVRIVYSPLDALDLARNNPQKKVVFFAVGFETTAPNTAMAAWQAKKEGLQNFSLLVSHALVPPAMRALLSSPDNRVQAYLAAGHVCAIMGWQPYQDIAKEFRVPIVVTGFEPVDLLQGILQAVGLLEEGRAEVVNAYGRNVRKEGNVYAQERISEVLIVCDRKWRGIGAIPSSGWRLRDEFAAYDAEKNFALPDQIVPEPVQCISGLVLQGRKKPTDCPAFSVQCTPQTPLGATMVSSEGACAAYFYYHARDESETRSACPG
jgi:hydrogenase expression/formation protein HypD